MCLFYKYTNYSTYYKTVEDGGGGKVLSYIVQKWLDRTYFVSLSSFSQSGR
jgi:hypothetical protein